MFRRILAVSAAAILPALLFTASAPSDAASSGVTVAAATITSPGGAAMPGAKVDLYTWPTDAVLSAMKPGQAVPTTLLATGTTSNVGGYTLRVPAARLRAAAVESGYANLEIFSPVGMWFLPYQTGSLPARPPAPVTVTWSAASRPPAVLTPTDAVRVHRVQAGAQEG